MDKKITRRAVLGTIIGGLVAGPFVITALRRNRLAYLTSPLDIIYRQNSEVLSFPRRFEPDAKFGDVRFQSEDDWPPAPPKEIRDRIFATQRRFWQNYSKLDELKFVLSSSYYVGGKMSQLAHNFEGADVWAKLGYGVEIKGKNRLGKQIHLFYNLDGESKQPDDEHRVNLRGFLADLLGMAYPAYAKQYTSIEENVVIPNSFRRMYTDDPPYPQGLPVDFGFETHQRNCLYTQLTGNAESIRGHNNIFRNRYFNQETGMLELEVVESMLENYEHCSPLYEIYTYQNVNGVYFPLKICGGKIDGWKNGKKSGNEKVYAWEKEYSDVRIKLIS